MKFVNSRYRCRLSDEHLSSALQIMTSEKLTPNITSIIEKKKRCQVSSQAVSSLWYWRIINVYMYNNHVNDFPPPFILEAVYFIFPRNAAKLCGSNEPQRDHFYKIARASPRLGQLGRFRTDCRRRTKRREVTARTAVARWVSLSESQSVAPVVHYQASARWNVTAVCLKWHATHE